MNTTNVYSIFDSKAEAHMQPFFADTHGLALRTFEKHINNPETIFNAHPADFTLFYIGTFDEQTGKLNPNSTPFSLGVAIEFATPKLESVT